LKWLNCNTARILQLGKIPTKRRVSRGRWKYIRRPRVQHPDPSAALPTPGTNASPTITFRRRETAQPQVRLARLGRHCSMPSLLLSRDDRERGWQSNIGDRLVWSTAAKPVSPRAMIVLVQHQRQSQLRDARSRFDMSGPGGAGGVCGIGFNVWNRTNGAEIAWKPACSTFRPTI
jgi:hypothetical protein